MGYHLGTNLGAELTVNALKMALKQRSYSNQLIHHSDRGFQYCSNAYQKLLKENQVIASMTEDGSPYSNAIAERVNGILKQEFIFKRDCSYEVLKVLVKNAIEIYNTKRPHLSCNLLTPMVMHQQS